MVQPPEALVVQGPHPPQARVYRVMVAVGVVLPLLPQAVQVVRAEFTELAVAGAQRASMGSPLARVARVALASSS